MTVTQIGAFRTATSETNVFCLFRKYIYTVVSVFIIYKHIDCLHACTYTKAIFEDNYLINPNLAPKQTYISNIRL